MLIKWTFWNENVDTRKSYSISFNNFSEQYSSNVSPLLFGIDLITDGASLHYLSPGHQNSHLSLLSLLSPSGVLQPLIPAQQYTEIVKPNVVDREHVLVPSGWDSWGKIRVLRDGFDVEGVCDAWSVDLAQVLGSEEGDKESSPSGGGALEVYEETVFDPKRVCPLSHTSHFLSC
jgi:dynein light intermediate chain 1, cytosolic